MVLERVIGSGTTNSNGQIVIPYTGVGAGKLQLKAKATVNGSIIQSETYSILDAMFYDTCTTGTQTVWYNESNVGTSVTDTGMVISLTTSGNKYIWAKKQDTTPSQRSDANQFAPSFNVEFDVAEYTGTVYLQISDGTNGDRNRTISQMGVTTSNHILIEVRSDSIKYYKDGTEITGIRYSNITQGTSRVGIFLQNTASVKIKDFKIYPI